MDIRLEIFKLLIALNAALFIILIGIMQISKIISYNFQIISKFGYILIMDTIEGANVILSFDICKEFNLFSCLDLRASVHKSSCEFQIAGQTFLIQ